MRLSHGKIKEFLLRGSGLFRGSILIGCAGGSPAKQNSVNAQIVEKGQVQSPAITTVPLGRIFRRFSLEIKRINVTVNRRSLHAMGGLGRLHGDFLDENVLGNLQFNSAFGCG